MPAPLPPSPPAAPTPHLLAGRYQLTAPRTATPAVTVHPARDLRLHRAVAVELVRPEQAATELARRRLFRGAVLAAGIDHPQVMPLLDFGEERGADGAAWVFRVTPPRRGWTLGARGPEGWRSAVELGLQLLAGVGALHRAGGVHGAIRPAGCLVARVDGRETLRLLEVGLGAGQGAAAGGARRDVVAAAAVLRGLLTGPAGASGAGAGARGAATSPPHEPVPGDILAIVDEAAAGGAGEGPEAAPALAARLAWATRSATPGCPEACAAARASLAAWTRFEYALAEAEARRAAEGDPGWSPLRLLMSCLPGSDDGG